MVVHPQDNFRRTVEATLDVRVDCRRSLEFCNEICGAERILLFSCSKQLLPKSMTLIALFAGCRKRTFLERHGEYKRLQAMESATYLRLEITVNDAMVAHERQRLQHLARETTNETGREAMEVVRLDQFVEVDAQELHRNAEMSAEVEVLRHLDDMVLLLGILIHAE